MRLQALLRIDANRGGPMWNLLFNDNGYSSPQDIISAMDAAIATHNPLRFLQVSVWIHLDILRSIHLLVRTNSDLSCWRPSWDSGLAQGQQVSVTHLTMC